MGDRALITAAGNASQNVSPAAYIFQRHEKQGWVPWTLEVYTVDGSEIPFPTTVWMYKTVQIMGNTYQL